MQTDDFKPTNYLRWYVRWGQNGEKISRLQQKWVTETGKEEWAYVHELFEPSHLSDSGVGNVSER